MKPYLAALVKKLGIPQAALEDFTAMFSLGEPAKVPIPKELIPIGAKLVAKGLWNTVVSGLTDDFVLPYWMEKQFRPGSSSFIPRGHILTTINTTHRNWTGLSLPYLNTEAFIDPKGLVSPRPDAYGMETYLAVGKDLFYPSRSPRVKQALEEDLPVTATTFSLKGVRLRQTNFVTIIQRRGWLVHSVEVTNTARALRQGHIAISIRPFNVEGPVPIQSFYYLHPFVNINGKEELVLLTEPTKILSSPFAEGDVAQDLFGKEKEKSYATCPKFLLTSAFLFPFALKPREKREVACLARLTSSDHIAFPGEIAISKEKKKVFSCYARCTKESTEMRTSLPAVSKAYRVNRNFLLMLVDKESITPGVYTYHHFWFRDAAFQVTALDKAGLTREAEQILRTYPRRMRRDGFFISQDGEWDSNGQALFTLAHHYFYTRNRNFLEEVFPSIKKGVAWIFRKASAPPYGLFPAGFSTEHGGPNDYFFWDNFWAVGGVQAAQELAEELHQVELAREWEKKKRQLFQKIVRTMKNSKGAKTQGIVGATPTRLPDGAIITNLCSVYPLQLLSPDHPVVFHWTRFLLDRYCRSGAYYHPIIHSGYNIYLTLHLAQVLLQQRDPVAFDLFTRCLQLATPTGTYPEAVHPTTLGGCMGDGHHGWAVAEIVHFARALFFTETRDQLTLFPLGFKPLGGEASLERAPSRFGKLSLQAHLEKKALELSFAADFALPPNTISLTLPQKPKSVEVNGKPWEAKAELLLPSTLQNLRASF